MTENEVISFWKDWNQKSCNAHGMHTQISISIDALENQVPKKPICIEDKMWCCPICYNNLMWKWKKYPTELNDRSEGFNHCMSCGQKLDWSE